MDRSEIHRAAVGRGEARREFLVLAVVYATVLVLLIVMNLATQPGPAWFIWPLLGWGLAIALHWGPALPLPGGTNTAAVSPDRKLHRAGERRSGRPR